MAAASSLEQTQIDLVETALLNIKGPTEYFLDVAGPGIQNKLSGAADPQPNEIPWVYVKLLTSSIDYTAPVNFGNRLVVYTLSVVVWIYADAIRFPQLTAKTLVNYALADVRKAIELYAKTTSCGSLRNMVQRAFVDSEGTYGLVETELTYEGRQTLGS